MNKENEYISLKGLRVNNLKNISLNIPRNHFIAIAGVSGSGKSSLAFDTLYAEGQRRYVESLSSYARQFLGRMNKPECDYVKGLPPAIAIEQKVISRNPRSTVGTSTEIYEYMRLLFARVGHLFSPISNQEVKKHTAEDVVERMLSFTKGTKFMIAAPLHLPENRKLGEQLQMMIQEGYSRLMIDGSVVRIDDFIEENPKKCDAYKTSDDIYLLIDRMSADDDKDTISRLTDSAETAFFEGHGECRMVILPSNIIYDFSTKLEADGMEFEMPTDQTFAFNSPVGVCPECQGFGSVIGIDEHLVIPDSSLSVYDGCVKCWHGDKMGEWLKEFVRRAQRDNFPIFTPYCELSNEHKSWLWHGLPSDRSEWKPCIDSFFKDVQEHQYKIQYRVMLARYRGKTICPSCHGNRLRKEASYVKINGKSITDLINMPIIELKQWFDNLQLNDHDAAIAKRLLVEINNRLGFLLDVGLGYLTLNRPSNTLSGGESQRINLTTSLGSSLVGSLYILDEPSIGMHSRDTEQLIGVLKKLNEIGNTVIVVEHDEDILRAADYLIDIGPDAGSFGGEVVFQGNASEITVDSLKKYPKSHTVEYLTGVEQIETPSSRRPWNRYIRLNGARMNNLKGINVDFPLNCMTVVTGVSGSGKSSLVRGILYPALKRHLDEVADMPGEFKSIEGDWKDIAHVEMVDQNPIGKTTRSNPVTYLKIYDHIRQLFANQPLAKQTNITAQYFSFNTDGGRCEECKGAGVVTIEMQFMADLVLTCDSCHGKRFKREVLDVTYEGKDINNVLAMSVTEAIEFFSTAQEKDKRNATTLRAIVSKLRVLEEVGLGYIQLGQSSSTLSGGENQRVKLAYYISQERQNHTLFIFDEPTTGLHFHDIKRLLQAFDKLIERGHSILIIEHNMDVIKCADHIIDLGPEGGNLGGSIVCQGTPEDIIRCPESHTGRFLAKVMK